MKRLCCDHDVTGCNQLKSILESEGIPCFVRNENMASLFGGQGSIMGAAFPELWVINDEDFEKALEILNAEPEVKTNEEKGIQPTDANE